MARIPSTREERLEFIQEEFLPRLPEPEWIDEFPPSDDELDASGWVLAQTYQDLGMPMVWGILVLVLLLLALDAAVRISAQVYGLYIDLFAAIFFLSPSLKSPADIASAVEADPGVVRIMEAKEMVAHNVGFIGLITGFGLQIIAVQSERTELLGENFLGPIPQQAIIVALTLVGLVAFWVLGRLRQGYLNQREFVST